MSGGVEVVVFPKSRGTVTEYCRKYTVGHGIRCRSRPGYRPWYCRDHAGILPAPAGGVVVAGVWSFIYGAVAFGGPCRLGSCKHKR
jgi:hypothetical protein